MTSAARARWSVNAVFFLHGVTVSNWLARIPAVQQKLALPIGVLGLTLLATAAGAMFGMPLAARLVGRFHSAPVTRVSTALFCLVLPLPGIVPRAWMLAPALFLFGLSAAAMEVSMNTQAIVVETALARPVMTSFHALFSLGGMAGSLMGGFAAAHNVAPAVHLCSVAPLLLAAALLSTRSLLPDGPRRQAPPAHWLGHLSALWGLGLIAFCILIGEGAMADWTAVYLTGLPSVSPGAAAAGYAVFSVCMALGRLSGDWFRRRFPEIAIIRAGASLASVGLASGLAAGGLSGALIGFACAGFGFSSIFPILTLKAGQIPSVSPQAGVAAVTAAGYTGFLSGPPIIGFLAQASSLRLGLALIPLLSALAALLCSRVLPPQSPNPA